MEADRGALESDTLHRMLVEAARYWVVEHHQRTGQLPEEEIRFAYAGGSCGFDWGNPPGLGVHPRDAPLRGKRVRITLEIEDH